MAELASILIPAHNAERWIGETIESALSQTWPYKEVIVVDDGSTDDTLGVARGYASSLVNVIAQDNAGANVARNRALASAQGRYIQWLDADDLLAPSKVEAQMSEARAIGNPRILLTSPWGKFYYRTENATFSPDGLWGDLSPVEWLIQKFTNNAVMINAAWLVSRELTELAGLWDERLVRDQDGEYVSRLVSKSEFVRFVPAARSYYRQCNNESLSRQISERSLESVFLAKQLSIERLRSLEDSSRTRAASFAYLKHSLGFLDREHAAIAARVRSLVEDLGEQFAIPSRSWRYAVVERIFGTAGARHAIRMLSVLKTTMGRAWDTLPSVSVLKRRGWRGS